MSSRRLKIRLVWLTATIPVVGLGVFVSSLLLFPAEPVHGPHGEGLPYPGPPQSNEPTALEAAPLRSSTPSQGLRTGLDPGKVTALRDRARDRSAAPAERARALRRLAAANERRLAGSLAAEILSEPFETTLTRESLRVLGQSAGEGLDRREVVCLLLSVLERVTEAELALACGAALDSLGADPASASDLRHALDRTALPEGRVVLLRALALLGDSSEARAALEEAIRRDPSPLVRGEAFSLVAVGATDQILQSWSGTIVRDPALRAVAARALLGAQGTEADRILADAFSVEENVTVQRELARALAARSSAAPALIAAARGRGERAAVAADVLGLRPAKLGAPK